MKADLLKSNPDDMTSNDVKLIPTSTDSANVSSIILQETDLIRAKFIPKLVNNRKDSNKPVCGTLLYEKKAKKDNSFPSERVNKPGKISRRSIKIGDWMEIYLDTSETYNLYQGLGNLYSLYTDIGKIPHDTSRYTNIDEKKRYLLSLLDDEPEIAQIIGKQENVDFVKKLLQIMTEPDALNALKESIAELENDNIQHLTTSLNLARLQRAEALMKQNLDNDREEFWQREVFSKNQWILAQIFSTPCTIFREKTYVGGKSIDNTGGNVADFLYQNKLSQNVALIEIKTPCTKITGNQYRGTVSFSQELTGAVNQVLNYRDKLTKDYYSISANSDEPFKVISPKCIVVIGKMSTMNPKEIAAFENFRNNLNNILILTFDELYQRILELIQIFS